MGHAHAQDGAHIAENAERDHLARRRHARTRVVVVLAIVKAVHREFRGAAGACAGGAIAAGSAAPLSAGGGDARGGTDAHGCAGVELTVRKRRHAARRLVSRVAPDGLVDEQARLMNDRA